MTDSANLEQATQRLEKALEVFEAAIMKNRKVGETVGTLESEVEELRRDRTQLAQQLDLANERATKLAAANSHVGERIDMVMDNIRLLLSGV